MRGPTWSRVGRSSFSPLFVSRGAAISCSLITASCRSPPASPPVQRSSPAVCWLLLSTVRGVHLPSTVHAADHATLLLNLIMCLYAQVFCLFLPFTNYQTVKRHKYLLAKPTVRDSMAMNCLLVCYQLSCCSAQWEVADFEWGSWTQSSSNWAFLSLVYVVKAEANPWVTPTQAVICHQIAVLLNEKPRRAHWLLPFSMQHNMDTSRFWALAQFLPSVLRG